MTPALAAPPKSKAGDALLTRSRRPYELGPKRFGDQCRGNTPAHCSPSCGGPSWAAAPAPWLPDQKPLMCRWRHCPSPLHPLPFRAGSVLSGEVGVSLESTCQVRCRSGCKRAGPLREADHLPPARAWCWAPFQPASTPHPLSPASWISCDVVIWHFGENEVKAILQAQ